MKYRTTIFNYSFPSFSISFLYLLIQFLISSFPTHSMMAQSRASKAPEDNIPNQLNKVDLAPRVLDSNFHNEFWTYHFYMNNGMQVILRFSIANFGLARDPVSGAKISIVNIPGTDQTYEASKQYPYNELSYDTANSHLLLKEGKEIWFRGNINDEHFVKFDTNKNNDSYDIKFKLFDNAPGLIPFSGENDNVANTANPNEDISLMVHIPYAKTEGHVKVNDKKYDVSGTAYMDHIYLNRGVAKLFNSGMRFIHHKSDTNWVVGYIAETKNLEGYPLLGYAVQRTSSRSQNILLPINKTIRNSASVNGRAYPTTLDLILSDQTRFSMKFSKVYQDLSILENVGGLKKFVAKRYLGGEVINFRGIGKLNGTLDFYFNYFNVN